ncbi:MAG: putative toxin-antitoxin system toxin component, PIN family [Solirubrobacterales bacterium]
MRAVLDPNVIISAALSPDGSPARVLTAWLEGEFEVIASPGLIDELERALAYSKIRKRIPEPDAEALVRLIERGSVMREDPADPPSISNDPGDDYLIALAAGSEAALVSGDRDLLALAPEIPVFSAKKFLKWLEGLEVR